MIQDEFKIKNKIRNHNYYLKNKIRIIEKNKLWAMYNPEKEKKSRQKAHRNYYLKNREKLIFKSIHALNRRLNQKRWYDKNKDKKIEYSKRYGKLHRDKEKERIKNRRKTDLNFALKDRLRALLKCAIKRYSEGRKLKSIKYGIDYNLIIEHLKPFPENLSEYHIDHIIPLSFFDLTKQKEIKKAFTPENHQWLTIKENLQKHNHIIERGCENN